MSGARLPKLHLPDDNEAREELAKASKLARAGDIKDAQMTLRAAVTRGLVSQPLQRQVLAWWSASCFDLPGLGIGEGAAAAESQATKQSTQHVDSMEASIAKVMRQNRWSRKEAMKYIEDGGLEAEAMQAEASRPMDEAFEKMKEKGPPQWFVDMLNEKQAAAESNVNEGGQAGEEP
mmetsp:Transcript_18486/g.36248  ORF Transcript_18486/g.36248 Transcript_18486/m.36248 type:complete len:177 (+) Transcript_18486:44-574(+)|eukprot:CAMPEP_0172763724 /NCGR_PEP_ID=MMETSP1074-20121228/175915_1 /TAXON_ID=2916 /ORGANISM="Ceratium fusus, Strain PA161109" /LENGTH=176 /DNA_ID=CAMNT_0013598357 /DNA_START=42 /DNA_END=572 /DNA_ORIENTATION=-